MRKALLQSCPSDSGVTAANFSAEMAQAEVFLTARLNSLGIKIAITANRFFTKLIFFFPLTANCSTLGVTNEQGLNLSWAALSREAIFPISAAEGLHFQGALATSGFFGFARVCALSV